MDSTVITTSFGVAKSFVLSQCATPTWLDGAG